MSGHWLKSFVVAVSLSLVTGREAIGQPITAYDESIECTVINSDFVIIAKLIDFGDKRKADRGREVFRGTIDIEQTLKGTLGSEPSDKLGVDLPYPESVLAGWKKHSNRLLLAVNQDASYLTRVIALKSGSLEVLTEDFELLREPESVIRVARKTVSATHPSIKRIHTFAIGVPRELLKGTKWESSFGLRLEVPVNEQLEEKALEGLRSKSSIKRAEGVHALRYFKSDNNIKRVKPLLNDPGFGVLQQAEVNNGVEVRIYSVRREAFRTLKSWGVSVEEPVIRKEVTK